MARRLQPHMDIPYSSSESSSDSDSEDELPPPSYDPLCINSALQNRLLFPEACRELGIIVNSCWTKSYKCAEKQVIEDVLQAIACCEDWIACTSALHNLMTLVEHSPIIKKSSKEALQRAYKKLMVQMTRARKKNKNNASAYEDSDSSSDGASCAPLPEVFPIPNECIEHVLKHLDPITLAKAACVNKTWKAACSKDELWEPLFAATFPKLQSQQIALVGALHALNFGKVSAMARFGLLVSSMQPGQPPSSSFLLSWTCHRVLIVPPSYGLVLAWINPCAKMKLMKASKVISASLHGDKWFVVRDLMNNVHKLEICCSETTIARYTPWRPKVLLKSLNSKVDICELSDAFLDMRV